MDLLGCWRKKSVTRKYGLTGLLAEEIGNTARYAGRSRTMSELGGDHSFHQLTAASAVFQFFSAFLQFKHQTQSPGLPNPVLAAGYLIMLFYLFYVLIDLFPQSRFADVAQHFLFSSAYATVGLLAVAVLPPASTPFIYTIFGLILAGRMLYLFGDRLEINWGDDADDDGDDGSNVVLVWRQTGE